MSEQDETMTNEELIERFAKIQNISIDEAKEQIGGETPEETLKNIEDFTINKINGGPKLNRAQRRALAKKAGKKGKQTAEAVSDTAKKLNYIDLIQRLRELNEKKEKEENVENATKTD